MYLYKLLFFLCVCMQIVLPRLNDSKTEHTTTEEVWVGSTKETLDMVGDHGLSINDVTQSFGQFLKYYVSSIVCEDLPPARNAFQVMFAAQQRLNSVKFPPIISVWNKRDELYNDLLSLLKSKDLHWESEEVQSETATRAIQTLRDALWYVDGSHLTHNERGCTIPALFGQFNGYNKLEKHKHRKQIPCSLSREVLLSHSQALFSTLQSPFWRRPLWSDMRNNVEQLARSFTSYADLLLTKRARMEEIHSSTEVVRQIGENITVSFTKCLILPPAFLSSINEAVKELDPDTPLN